MSAPPPPPYPFAGLPKGVAERWSRQPIAAFGATIVPELEQRIWLPLWHVDWTAFGWLIDWSVTLKVGEGFYVQSIHNTYDGPELHTLDVWVDNGEGKTLKLLHFHSPTQYPDPAIAQQRLGMRREQQQWLAFLIEALGAIDRERSEQQWQRHPGLPAASTAGTAHQRPPAPRLAGMGGMGRAGAGGPDTLAGRDMPPLALPHASGPSHLAARDHSMPVPYIGGATAADALNTLFDEARTLAVRAADDMDNARADLQLAWRAAWPAVYLPPTSTGDVAHQLALDWGAQGATVDDKHVPDEPRGTRVTLSRTGKIAYRRWLVCEALQRERVQALNRLCAQLPGGHDRRTERRPDGVVLRQCRRCGIELPAETGAQHPPAPAPAPLPVAIAPSPADASDAPDARRAHEPTDWLR